MYNLYAAIENCIVNSLKEESACLFYGRKISSLKSAALFDSVLDQFVKDDVFGLTLHNVVLDQLQKADKKVVLPREFLDGYREDYIQMKKCLGVNKFVINGEDSFSFSKIRFVNSNDAQSCSKEDCVFSGIPINRMLDVSAAWLNQLEADEKFKLVSIDIMGDLLFQRFIELRRADSYNSIMDKLDNYDQSDFVKGCMKYTSGDYSWCLSQADELL